MPKTKTAAPAGPWNGGRELRALGKTPTRTMTQSLAYGKHPASWLGSGALPNHADVSHDTAEMLRDEIHRTANLIGIQAHLAMTYSEIGDDAGLAYSIRALVSYAKVAAAHTADLLALKARETACDLREQPTGRAK